MADTTHHTATSIAAPLSAIASGIGRVGAYILESLTRMGEINSTAHNRLEQVERLQAKSDEDLAKLGIQRHEIPRYVFRDMFWT
jgi:uncharacterized protein YjiS (DUF1127 family)